MAGGRKLEAERQGAERQDEERATGAERPEVDATRRAWRIRLGRSNYVQECVTASLGQALAELRVRENFGIPAVVLVYILPVQY